MLINLLTGEEQRGIFITDKNLFVFIKTSLVSVGLQSASNALNVILLIKPAVVRIYRRLFVWYVEYI